MQDSPDTNLFGITDAFLDKIVLFLMPLFLEGAKGDNTLAQDAVRHLLASHDVRTNAELRHVALAVAFSLGALDSLGRSLATTLTINQVLRLRGNATALHRAATKNQDALDRLRKPTLATKAPAAETQATDLPASTGITDLLTFAKTSQQTAQQSTPQTTISRQQRRAIERQAEKARQHRQEAARRAERAANRKQIHNAERPAA